MAATTKSLLSSGLLTKYYTTIKISSYVVCQRRSLSTERIQNVHSRKCFNNSLILSKGLFRINAVRCMGTDNTTESSTEVLSTPYIPEPPLPPVQLPDEAISEIVQGFAGEPSLVSLGLAHWTPPGLIQSALEWLHVGGDLPWWGAIVAGTVILRICMFPLVILSQRNMAKMNNNMPQMQILQAKMSDARRNGDHYEAAKYGYEFVHFMKEKKLNPLKNFVVPLCQAPVFLSCFIGLRKMANLPVESMKIGGLSWFTDLTLSDPFFILPLYTCITLFITLEIGAEGGLRMDNTKYMRYVLRALPLVIFPFIINFPAAILWYWAITNTITLAQVSFLKIPPVREYFKIEKIVVHPAAKLPVTSKSIIESFRESMTNSKIAAEIGDRARADEMAFKKAGSGPIQKTYTYDPTKQIKSPTIVAKSPRKQ